MSVRVDIPESVAASLRLPEAEIETRLRTELAIALYGQGISALRKGIGTGLCFTSRIRKCGWAAWDSPPL